MFRRLTVTAVLLAAAFTPSAARANINPDNAYGTSGVAKVPIGCAPGTVASIASTAGYQGQVYLLAECAHGYDRLIRLTDAGTVDTGFGTGGHLTIKLPTSCVGTSVHLKATETGDLFLASEGDTFGSNPAMHVCLVRVTKSGKLWPGYGGATPIRHLDRVGGGQNTFVGLDVGSPGRVQLYSQRSNQDWRKAAAFVNVYASNGHPDPGFSGDGQASFVQPFAGELQWGGRLRMAITVDNGRGLAGVQLVAFNYNGTLNTSFAHDGSSFVPRSDLLGGYTDPGAFVSDSAGGIVFTTHFVGPGKQWIDLYRVGVTGIRDSLFNQKTQRISGLTTTNFNRIDLQATDGHYALGWSTSNDLPGPRTTGYNADGSRWIDLGTNGTAKKLATDWAPDRTSYYDYVDEGGPNTVIEVRRSNVS
ncbi:MAG: hypothetical protein ACJ72O_05265 [Marmoricola sp.]